jgi:hypothetical protein
LPRRCTMRITKPSTELTRSNRKVSERITYPGRAGSPGNSSRAFEASPKQCQFARRRGYILAVAHLRHAESLAILRARFEPVRPLQTPGQPSGRHFLYYTLYMSVDRRSLQ